VTRTLVGHDLDHDDPPPEDRSPRVPVEGLDRLRLLMACAMGTVLLSYALLVPPVVAIVLPVGMPLDAAFAATIPLWLAAHQIPLVVEGQPISVLPLLPTIVLVCVVGLGARWAARRLGGRFRADAGAVVAGVAGAHAAVAVLGSALLPGAAAVAVTPWAAMVGGGVAAGAAAALGVVSACGMPGEWVDRLPPWLPAAVRGAAVALSGLLVTGAAVLTTGLVLGADQVAEGYRVLGSDLTAGTGLTLLALGYLPNAVIAATSWALGPGLAMGTATASPFVTYGGDRSHFPLLAAFPQTSAPVWAIAVLLLPVGVGVLTGLRCGRVGHGLRVPAALGASVITAVLIGVLGGLAGGRLAAGPFDPIRLPVELLVPSALLLVGAPAVLVAWWRRNRGLESEGLPSDRTVAGETVRNPTARDTAVGDQVAGDEMVGDRASGAAADDHELTSDEASSVESDSDATSSVESDSDATSSVEPDGDATTSVESGTGQAGDVESEIDLAAPAADDPADDPADAPTADDASERSSPVAAAESPGLAIEPGGSTDAPLVAEPAPLPTGTDTPGEEHVAPVSTAQVPGSDGAGEQPADIDPADRTEAPVAAAGHDGAQHVEDDSDAGSAVPAESAGVATPAARDEPSRRSRSRRVTPAPSSRRRFGWSRRRGSSAAPPTDQPVEEPVDEPGTGPPRTVAELVAQRARIAAAQQAEIETWVRRAADDDTAR